MKSGVIPGVRNAATRSEAMSLILGRRP